MRISDRTIETLLRGVNKLTDAQLEELKAEEKKTNRPLQDLVVRHELTTEKELTQLYATQINVPFTEIIVKDLTNEIVGALPERIARQYSAVVFRADEDGTKHIAMEDPDDVQAVDFLKKYIGTKFVLYIATKENILLALETYRGAVEAAIDKVVTVEQDMGGDEQVDEQDIAEDSPIAQTVNLILDYAIRAGASDIHIEPRDETVQIRYRVDGVLKEANKLPKNALNALVSRIKILSNLKIDEHRVPQDGRFKINLASKMYAFRVSTLPITTGEKVVMRILDESSKALSLEQLGYWGWSFKSINEAIVQPNGMILVTGPTGSGKSTSLFSVLSILNNATVNISTVEDPVEYKIEGANQTQVNPQAGMTFVAGLRALLRQDPNIIMVGEIRDKETADLGVQAALTGHLVFSTLHTNNAATCLPRLLDMGIEPFLIATTVRAVVGQRLVRKLCGVCKESYTPTDVEQKHVREIFGIMTPENMVWLHNLESQAAREGVGSDIGAGLSTDDNGIIRFWRAHPNGCGECNGTGYKSRMGIYEVLVNSVDIQNLIVGNGTSTALQDQAIREGMTTMQTDGFIKSLRGQTSVEEILRVTRE